MRLNEFKTVHKLSSYDEVIDTLLTDDAYRNDST